MLFSQSLEMRKGRSFPLTSQLLLVLSDGRGVFADGTTVSNDTVFESWPPIERYICVRGGT